MPIEYMFCFICSEQCIKSFRQAKSVACLVLYARKSILNNTTPTFQEVGGVTLP